MSSSSGNGNKPKNRAGWVRKALIAVPVIVILLFLIAFYFSHKKNESEPATVQTQTMKPSVSSSATATYVVEIPKGGSVAIPAKNDANTRSDSVHIPSGFTICRDADRGSGSYSTWYRNQSISDDWQPESIQQLPTATQESYMSNSVAQSLSYHFVPISSHC